MIIFFAVVNYMVRKLSFCKTRRRCRRKHHPFTYFYQFEKNLYFMKHDPEVKSFIQIVTFIIHTKRLASRVAVNFVDQTRSCASINHLGTPLQRCITRKYS